MSTGPDDYVVDQGLGLMPKDDDQQVQPVVDQSQQQPVVEPKINPAWNELLSQVPENLRGSLTPHLQKWDQNYQRDVEKVHSQYEPYKAFAEQGLDPTVLNNAMLIQQALEDDPQKFAEALIEHYKIQIGEQGQQSQQPLNPALQDEDPVFDITQNPEFIRMKQMTELLAQQTLTQHEQQELAAADSQIEQELVAATAAHGNYDQQYVLQYAYTNNCNIETAVQAYKAMEQGIITQYQSPGTKAPRLMGGGGGLPTNATPAGNLSASARKALIVQTLSNLEASGG